MGIKETVQNEIAYYNALPCVFEDFMDVPTLSSGFISLVCIKKAAAVPERKRVPYYLFDICLNGEKIGEISLRIGYVEGLYYGGQIAYDIEEAHRGNGYALRACRLLAPVARFHNMPKLLITNEESNIASRRVCEKLGAKFIRIAELPDWHELYKEGQRFVNIFEWDIFVFNGFIDVPPLSDGVIRLECKEKTAAVPEENKVPMYFFDIYKDDIQVGSILLRIGYTEEIYYSGHIGYGIDEAHRGNGYAVRACRLLADIARDHDMVKLLITNDVANAASQRVCEKLGAKFLRRTDIPQWHHEYEEGFRHMNIFEWDLTK